MPRPGHYNHDMISAIVKATGNGGANDAYRKCISCGRHVNYHVNGKCPSG